MMLRCMITCIFFVPPSFRVGVVRVGGGIGADVVNSEDIALKEERISTTRPKYKNMRF